MKKRLLSIVSLHLKAKTMMQTIYSPRLFSAVFVLMLTIAVGTTAKAQNPQYGATTPFKVYETEDATLAGGATVSTQIGVPSEQTVEFEASGRSLAVLNATNEMVTWTVSADANAIVVRNCIPDAASGGGINATLDLYVNGVFRQALNLTSKYTWIYGSITQNAGQYDNNPTTGNPKKFWESTRAFITGPTVTAGSTISLKKSSSNTAAYYKIDLITLENVGPALSQPANTLSITSYGAIANDGLDDSQAYINCNAACVSQGKDMWIPPGTFHNNRVITLGDGVSIYGAGMWYSTMGRLVTGNYTHFNVLNGNIQDFYIDIPCTARSQAEGKSWGINCYGGNGYTVQRIWGNRCAAMLWASGSNVTIQDCRVTEGWADGINLNNQKDGPGGPLNMTTHAGLNITCQNNWVMGTCDDGIAINAQNGGGTANNMVNTKVLNNTTSGCIWGNGLRIAGGRNSLVKGNYLHDNCDLNGLYISTFGTNGNPCESATVTENYILRAGGVRTWVGEGAVGLRIKNANATISNNIIMDSNNYGIQLATNSTSIVSGNTINHPTLDGIHILAGSVGSSEITGNTVTDLRSGRVAYKNDATNFTATVTNNSWQTVAVTGVTVSPSAATVSAGNTTQLTATVAPSNASNKTVSWSTSNAAVATVNSTGLVTAVTSGTATITVTTQDGGKTATSAITVTTAPTGSQTYQAENAAYSGAVIATNQPGYHGTGFIDFVNNTGDYVQWTVNAPAAGKYDLSFRYALPNSGRPLELKVNGTVKVASLDFPATTSWDNWMTVTSTQNLVAGSNTIRLTTIGSNGGNIDELSVIPYLDDCDALATWTTASANTLTYNTTDKKQGTGCLQMVGSATDEFKRSFATPLNSGVSIANGVLSFWYYVSDVTKCGTVRVELGSGGAADVNELGWPLTGLVNGWNYITLNTSDAAQTGSPNMSALNWFRIYNPKTGSITTRLDAIRILDSQSMASSQLASGPTMTNLDLQSPSGEKSVIVYPNPYKDGILSIDLTAFETLNNVKIKVVSLSGQTVYEKSHNSSSHIELNLAGQLKESLYIISIEAGGTKVVKKLVVN